jgi:energy-coupling factor transporter ATP-binding protein EcfA2
MPETPLHIVNLEVENVMKVRAVRLSAGGEDVIPVVGNNGSGKSSLLTAVQMALGGKRAFPEDPLRHGAKSGRIELDAGEYKIEWKLTAGGAYLTLRDAAGAVIREPQRVLDTLTGSCADPMAFLALKPAAQRELLMKLAGLDFGAVDDLRDKYLAERTIANRDAKALDARERAALKTWPADLPEAEVSVAEITRELRAAEAMGRERAAAEQLVTQAQNAVDAAKRALATAEKTLERVTGELDALPVWEPQRVADLERRVNTAEATNRAVRERAEYRRIADERARAYGRAERLEAKLAEIAERKEAMLQGADLPVDGLTVTDDGVLYNGVPVAQASTAEQIRLAVAVALAGSPRFRIVIVKDGSLLDDTSRGLLEAAVREAGAQLLIELVRADDQNGVFLVDGEQVTRPPK